ncbi:restriction endonuclease subunit S [Lentzea sp. NPDC034063]|uniref:restriction endonuclease subunit S n=1 Tax=unclassified Lentzea TaxID=2643253 RepID=UPI0033CE5E75
MFESEEAQVPLRDLVEITPGPSGSLLDRLGDHPGGVPVVSPSDITDRHQVATQKLRLLPRQEAKRLDRHLLRVGDIVVVRQGALGRLAHIGQGEEGWLYNSSCIRLRPVPELVVPEYLTLYLAFPPVQELLLGRAVPGTVQSLNSALLGDLPVVLPPFGRQQQLVRVAANIDELAQVHRSTLERLELLRTSVISDFLGTETRG